MNMKRHRISLLRKEILFLSLFSVLSIFCPISAQAILIADKDWRQLTETLYFSYNDLVTNGICDASTGACSGTLRGVDFTGWTWATVAEVGAMFSALGIGPPNLFDTPVYYNEVNSVWAPLAIDIDGSGPDTGLFHATWIGPASADVLGVTRTLSGPNAVYPPYTPALVDWYASYNSDFAMTARVASLIVIEGGVWLYRTTSPPDIEVSPVSYDFGNVRWGQTSTTMLTISNVGGGQLTLSAISLSSSLGVFSITSTLSLPQALAVGQSITVEVTFSPKAIQSYTGGFLTIASNDADEPSINISLSGTGVLADTPSEQVEAVTDYIRDSVAAGELTGVGSGNSANQKVQALINMIEAAGDLLEAGQMVEGCQQLADLYLKVDGATPPPDFVTGEAREGLANAIQGLRAHYGCQ